MAVVWFVLVALNCAAAFEAAWSDNKKFCLVFKFAKLASETIGGKGGGGRKDFAQAGGQDQSKINDAFEKIKSLI